MTMPSVTVIIPTLNRPDSLTRAVGSLFEQSLAASGFSILIVDNSSTGSAASAITKLQAGCPSSINLGAIHVPAPGVADARNAAMAQVATDLVAFLDDDQSAPETWLAALLAAYKDTPATVTFGPVETALPDQIADNRPYFETFFARIPEHETGYIEASYGCGNALIDVAQLPGSAPWFDVAMNERGGEDDVLFDRIRCAGGTFAWAGKAAVFEHPPIERIHLNYTLRRAFSYGQAPVSLALGSKRWSGALLWMGVGAGKALFHGLIWLILCLVRHPNRVVELDKAVRGLGKVFWPIRLKFYGSAAAQTTPPVTQPPAALPLDAQV